MRIGKLSNEQLKDIVLSKLRNRHDVLLGAGVGEDCAALDFNGQACVLSTDPITGACENIGALAVHVSCNDVASSGAHPVAILVTLLIPPHKELNDVEKVISDIVATANSLDIDIIGGHTEVTDAVTRIVVSTTVIGRTKSDELIKSSGANVGDDVIMTKYAAVEGTYIIASEHKDKLKSILSDKEFETADALCSLISVIKEGTVAGKNGATSRHDITEGGVFGAVHELCEASNVGCVLYKDKIAVLDVTRKICDGLSLNAYRLIGSGSMLITTPNASHMLKVLSDNKIEAAVIGKITEKDVCLVENGKTVILSPPDADELFSL